MSERQVIFTRCGCGQSIILPKLLHRLMRLRVLASIPRTTGRACRRLLTFHTPPAKGHFACIGIDGKLLFACAVIPLPDGHPATDKDLCPFLQIREQPAAIPIPKDGHPICPFNAATLSIRAAKCVSHRERDIFVSTDFLDFGITSKIADDFDL